LLKDRWIWVDGNFVRLPDAKVHLLSQSFARGSAIFEVLSAYHTRQGVGVFRLKDHLKRLDNSAREMMMELPYGNKQLFDAALKTVRRNAVDAGLLKIIAYYPEVGLEILPHDTRVSVAVAAFAFGRDVTISKFGEDRFATAGISKWRKPHPESVPVHAKASGNYLNPMLAKLEVRKRGFKTPILLDLKGRVAEGATESLFLVKHGRLLTARLDNILASITRMSIIEIAADLKIPVAQKDLLPRDLMNCDEAFFSSTTCKVWPISRIEKHKLAAPGPVSVRLRDYFDRILAGDVPKYRKWFSLV
jgi:branched-chain amino acid aminotransferase